MTEKVLNRIFKTVMSLFGGWMLLACVYAFCTGEIASWSPSRLMGQCESLEQCCPNCQCTPNNRCGLEKCCANPKTNPSLKTERN